MEKRFTRNEGHPFCQVNLGEHFHVREKSCHLCASQSRACACSDYLILTPQVDPAWAAKASVYNVYWRNVCPAKRVALPSRKRVTVLAMLAFCFSCKQCPKFYKKMNKKLACLGWLGYLSNPSPQDKFSPCKRGQGLFSVPKINPPFVSSGYKESILPLEVRKTWQLYSHSKEFIVFLNCWKFEFFSLS